MVSPAAAGGARTSSRARSLSHDVRLLAVAADHPLSDRSEVTTEDIADYEVVDLTGLVPPELADCADPRDGRVGTGR